MFRSFRTERRGRVEKAPRLKRAVRDPAKLEKLERSFERGDGWMREAEPVHNTLVSPIITLQVGREGRLFAAHEDVLCLSPFFAQAIKGKFFATAHAKRIELPDEEPEIFSAVLEYLYKGDYYPRLLHSKKRDTWSLEDSVPGGSGSVQATPDLKNGGVGAANTPRQSVEATTYITREGEYLLRDTAIYCLAEKFGLMELKALALRKQGLQSGIEVGTILRSARYAYENTPDTDSRLRAHYLALIIRCRKTFRRSGTMQREMEEGGKLFFDLFVALCNHVDDIVELGNARSPKAI